jgi:PAS domain S-box-containing protein
MVRQTEERFRLLVEGVADYAIVMLDVEGNVISWNAGAERIKGYKTDEIIGRSFSCFYTPEDVAAGIPGKELQTAAAEKHFETECWRVRKDGSRFWAGVIITPLNDADGKLRGFAKITRDVTERKQAEEALRKKEEELRQSQKLEAVGALAGGVAHEFNNLLQAIRAFTKFAMNGLLPQEKPCQDLQEVLKASDRAVVLTRQLLGFSRRQPFQPADLDINAILADLEKMLRPLIGENIELNMILDDRVGRLLADPIMIQQMVMNLCINARDAMPSGGTLSVKTEDAELDEADCRPYADSRPGRYVKLTVSDTGAGIATDVVERIFEPFFTTKEMGKGTGLGLSMVYGAVKQHRGIIRVDGRPGEGAVFEIFLPVAQINPDVPVLFCSGHDRDSADLEPTETPAANALVKPVDPETLLAAVRETLDRSVPCSVN